MDIEGLIKCAEMKGEDFTLTPKNARMILSRLKQTRTKLNHALNDRGAEIAALRKESRLQLFWRILAKKLILKNFSAEKIDYVAELLRLLDEAIGLTETIKRLGVNDTIEEVAK